MPDEPGTEDEDGWTPQMRATHDELERLMETALLLKSDAAAVSFLVGMGVGSELTCGILICRARGGEGDLVNHEL